MEGPEPGRYPRVPPRVYDRRDPTPALGTRPTGLTESTRTRVGDHQEALCPGSRHRPDHARGLGPRGIRIGDTVEATHEFTSNQQRESEVATNGDVALAFYDLFELALDAVGSHAVMESVFINYNLPLLLQRPYTFRARITHVIDRGPPRRLRLQAEARDSRGQQAASAVANFVNGAHLSETTIGPGPKAPDP